MSNYGSSRQRMRAVIRRQALTLRRGSHRWFDVAIWPVVDTVLWGSLGAFSEATGGTKGDLAFLLTGVFLMHVVYQSSIAVSTGFLDETWSRTLLNTLVTPIKDWEYFAALATFSLVKLAIGTGVVALASWVGYGFSVSNIGFSLVPIYALVVLVGWTVSLVVIGLILRFGKGAEILTWGIMFIVIALSGIFYPTSALPPWLRPISNMIPATHAFDAAREVVAGGPMPWGQVGYAAIGTLVCGGLAVWYATRMLTTFRRRGFATRYS